jgi:transposase
MPWQQCSKMEERLRFVARLMESQKMAVLCREFDISRKTGYKIFSRYKDAGLEGLTDRSRRPYRQGCQLPFQIEQLILQVKREHPSWGAPKIREKIRRKHEDILLPAIWIGVSNARPVQGCPPPLLRVTGLFLRPSLGAAWLAWKIWPPVGFGAEPSAVAGPPSQRAAPPATHPLCRSLELRTSGPRPPPSPAHGIATHPPVHSRLGCSGGPRAPSGSSL